MLPSIAFVVPAPRSVLRDVAQPHPSEGRHQRMLDIASWLALVDARSGSLLAVRRLAIHLLAFVSKSGELDTPAPSRLDASGVNEQQSAGGRNGTLREQATAGREA